MLAPAAERRRWADHGRKWNLFSTCRKRGRMVKRAAVVLGIAMAVLLRSAPLAAAPPAKVWRIGVLHAAWAPNVPWVDGLRSGLNDLGLAEGHDFTFEHRYTEGNLEMLSRAAAELVAVKVDLIFTSNDEVTRAAMATTRTIPIVFASGRDPVGVGIVSTLAHPQGNVTGISNLTIELTPKRVEMLKQLVPTLRRVWFIYYAGDPGNDAMRQGARDAAARLELELLVRPVRTVEELTRARDAIRPGDGILVPDQPNPLDISAQLLERSLAVRVPAIFTSEFWIAHGALVSYGADYRASGYQAARLVAKILRGARPQDLPVETANKVRLVINLKTARSLGLTVPPSMMMRADQVVE